MNSKVKHYKRSEVLKDPEIRTKGSKTILEIYGVSNVSQSEEIKQKKVASSLLKYGVDNPMKSDEVKEKRTKTNIERYGGPSPMASSEVKALAHETIENKKKEVCSKLPQNLDGVEKEFENYYTKERSNRSPNTEVSGIIKVRDGGYGYQTDVLKDKVFEIHRKRCSGVHRIDVLARREFEHILKEQNIDYVDYFTLIDSDIRYEYDFKLKENNTLVKLDSTVTNNCYVNIINGNSGVSKNFLSSYSRVAKKNGYRCLHVFDWEDKEAIVSILKPTTSIYARKCMILEIDSKTCNKFEDENHIQGKCVGQKKCYGLYYRGELVEVMTFGKPRYNKKFQWELMRLCTKTGVTVVGGASKLFKHFVDSENPDSIISYCDRAKFNGDVYLKMGMYLDHITDSNKIWSSGKEYITNNFLLQRGFDQIFGANYGRGTSNDELMLLSGWLPVYDCGQNVYGWRKSV